MTEHVAFSKAFDAMPHVTATPKTSVPNGVSVGVSNVTASGFDVVVYRTATSPTTVDWIATQ